MQYHKIYLLFVQRLSYVLFLFVLTERPRELFAADPIPIENGNLSMPENLVMRPLSVHTDSEGRGKKTR